ncbi:glutamate ABC transporter substrate-binding protein [Phytomonospora endophytica]|uniref:Glutamate transport system substrate-binding protein n=1 Tax=Phytomonospora endophytica TaxID=714109 RepID=A0A841FF39_9ACTN|nr:glutamate ABC transporter substrate-binding protein [Phytomonospora endophytica]MBB6032458.1 glutamate transport system substrate-binding protein [Phytomonospora endophytica]GIG66395.1 ABC transporter substrate-binding protein [Phytomonospora endophytica]
MTQAPDDSLPPEIQAIKDIGRLLVGTRYDQPLTGLRNEATGRIDGFDAEIGRIIAQRIFGTVEEGVNIEFIETLAKSRTTYLSTNQVDMVIATFTINDERKAEVDFAGPYYIAGQDILVKKDNKSIESVDDLMGKRVCAAKGSTSAKELKKQAGVEVVELKDYSSCVAALEGAQPVEAVSTDNVILQGFAQSNPDAYRVLDNPFTSERYGIGLKHGSPELRKFINDTLEESFRNGDWQKAFQMTFGHTTMKMPEYPKIENY